MPEIFKADVPEQEVRYIEETLIFGSQEESKMNNPEF